MSSIFFIIITIYLKGKYLELPHSKIIYYASLSLLSEIQVMLHVLLEVTTNTEILLTL